MNIKIYTTPTCPYCFQAKEFLKKKNIPFEEVDVSASQKSAEEMVKISGQMGVPVIQIGEEIIIGFDQERIEKALGK